MSGYVLESMNATFIGTLTFRWRAGPTHPAIIANRIERLGGELNDHLAPMVAARQILMDDIQDRFEREVDLENKPWQAWSPSYASWRKSHYPGKEKILQLSGNLYDAVTSNTSYPIVGNNLYINTADFPAYWRIHNQGGKTGKNVVPKRSFLGLSEPAGFAVIDVFDDWVARKLRINVNPLTGVAQAFVGNRFGPRIGIGRQRASSAAPPGMSWETGFTEMGTPFIDPVTEID